MIHVRWSATAFGVLEKLPPKTAFEILDSTDRLAVFPELDVGLPQPYAKFCNCRQLVFRRKYRLIYLYEAGEREIKILLLQQCRQQLPTMSELHRSLKGMRLDEEEGS
jgi:mRNA-degrading endonuclease RelE of RelBE toxin-antitoxin system